MKRGESWWAGLGHISLASNGPTEVIVGQSDTLVRIAAVGVGRPAGHEVLGVLRLAGTR